ncbi:hypothetical protein F5B21DRAFT_504475 [Xylaria acuta]|nr:hypothetical protein F5B21DRAFT_504475 [Xylaria acuta]
MIEQYYKGTLKGTLVDKFLADFRHQTIEEKLSAVAALQSSILAPQTSMRQGSQQVVTPGDNASTFAFIDDAVVETHNHFPVIIRTLGHDLPQPVIAAEYEGRGCYISEDLIRPFQPLKPFPSNPINLPVTWRKLDESHHTDIWCDVLAKSRISGKAGLFLGRNRKEHECDGGENLPDVVLNRELPRIPLSRQIHQHQHAALSGLDAEGGPPELRSQIDDQDIDSSDAVTDCGQSWTSSSDESSNTARGLVETRKGQIIGSIIRTTTQWLRYHFIQAHMRAREATTGSSEGGNTPSGALTQFPKDQVQRAGKRKLDDSGGDEGENHDSGDDAARPPPSGADGGKGKGKEILRFACPYFKYNRTKYQQWPNCPGPGWSDVHRVKEHLYRRHRQPRFRCARCWECFDSEQNYIDHQRALVPCELELGERESVEGFDADQERQLRSRKKKSHIVSETDKWNAVYQILFPHVLLDKIPSPFYEDETHTHEALTECEEYILREIPLRLREILVPEFDRDFQIIEQSLQRRAIESTRTIVASLFQEFRKLHQRGTIPTIAPMSSGSQDHAHAGPSSSQTRHRWFDSIESSGIALDQTVVDFDFDCAFAAGGSWPIFGDVQLQDILAAPTDLGNSALKPPDSGYESNNVERPNEQQGMD